MIDLSEHPDRPRVAERALGVAAALLLVIGLVAAAVGKDDGSADPIQLLGAAPDAARDAGTARMTLRTTTGTDVSTTGEGLVDFRTGISQMAMGVGAFEFEMRVIDGVIYMKVPGISTLPTPWVKIALPPGTTGPNGFAPGAGSVTGCIDSLRGVGEVTEGDRETINGVPTTRYHVVIDVGRAMDATPDDRRAELEQTFGTVPDLPDMPMDVWLSDDGLPVRTETSIEMAGLRSTTRVDLTDFGVDVDIEPPPADQVTEVADMAELSKLFTDAAGVAQ